MTENEIITDPFDIQQRQASTALALHRPIPEEENHNFFNLPTSTATNVFMEVAIAGENLAQLPGRKAKVDSGTKYEVREDGNARQVTAISSKSKVTVEINDIEQFTGSNKAAKKLLVLSLIKANEQAVHNGKLSKDYISFPLQELIDLGFYTTIQSARKGFKDGMKALTGISLDGDIQQSPKKKITVIGLHPFRKAIITDSQCIIQLETEFNWEFLIQYYTILPKYYFALPNRASDLLQYICYIARMRTRDIEEKGYFTISFRAIQQRLQLPTEDGNRRPQQTIKDPIEEAIEQIEDGHKAYYNNMEFSLLPVFPEDGNIKEYLDNGYLKVSLAGSFAKTFIEISKDTKKQITEAKKRKERIIDTAMAKKLEKSLENKDKAGD